MKKRLIFVILMILMIILTNSTVLAIQAPDIDTSSGESGSSGLGTDLGLGDLDNYKGTNATSQTLVSKANNILGIIQTIGVIVSVVMLMAIGIKYMLGSVEEKAEYKSSLKPYLIGAFVLFTGTTIPNIIFTIMQSI